MARTGAIHGNHCFQSQSEAVDSYYSMVAPSQTPGSPSYVMQFSKAGAVWYQNSFSVSSGGAWTTLSSSIAPVPTFPACDPSENFLDGVTIGWGIASAMILVSALMLARRGARSG